VLRDAGAWVSLGTRKSPHFCLECRGRAVATCTIGPASRLVPRLFLPGSRLQTSCFPVSMRAPVLFLWCAQGTSRPRQTIGVLSQHWPRRPGEDLLERDAVTGRKVLVSKQAHVGSALPVRASRRFASLCFHCCGQNRGRPGKGSVAPLHRLTQEGLPLGGTQTRRCPVPLLAVHAAAEEEEEGDGSFRARRQRRRLRCQRFLPLHHPLHHHRPVFNGKSVLGVFWPWSPFANHRRRAGVMCFVASEHVLDLEIQLARRGKEEGKNWRQRSRNPSVPVRLFIHLSSITSKLVLSHRRLLPASALESLHAHTFTSVRPC